MTVRFARLAERDLQEIADYTVLKFGMAQASRYMAELQAAVASLASHPAMGRRCDEVRAGLRRLEQGSHVIFYSEEKRGILIFRVLHEKMLHDRQAFES